MQTRQANTAYTLADVFRGMTLSEMQATAYDMSLPIPSKLRKAEYQEAIIHAIPEHIGDFLLRLARYELELLDQLVLIGSGKALIVPTLSINSALIANHIIQVEFLRNEHADCFTLSDELRPHIAQCLPAILNDPDRKPFDRLMQYAFGITNLYGALDYKKGMDMIVFRGMIDLDKPKARLLFKRFINSGFFLQCSQETIQNGKENQYFTSALMYELEPVLAETKARKKSEQDHHGTMSREEPKKSTIRTITTKKSARVRVSIFVSERRSIGRSARRMDANRHRRRIHFRSANNYHPLAGW